VIDSITNLKVKQDRGCARKNFLFLVDRAE